MANQASGERLYTRFLIYTTPDNGRTLNGVGDMQASSRDQALRRFLDSGRPDLDDGVTVLATMSENGIKLHIPSPRITLGQATAETTEPEPEPEPEPAAKKLASVADVRDATA